MNTSLLDEYEIYCGIDTLDFLTTYIPPRNRTSDQHQSGHHKSERSNKNGKMKHNWNSFAIPFYHPPSAPVDRGVNIYSHLIGGTNG